MTSARLPTVYRRHRFAVLFYSLILTLGAGPLVAALDVDRNWIRLFVETNLFAAVFGVTSGRWRPLRLLLALAVAARLLVLLVEVRPLAIAAPPLVIAIGFLTAVAALEFALRSTQVDAEHVYAALSAYLLVGIFAAMLYFELERFLPGSFASNGAPLASFPIPTAIYFSFVTLATLGYGDIVPQTEIARGFTVVEAIIGQLYLAVLMARLVSVYVPTAARERRA